MMRTLCLRSIALILALAATHNGTAHAQDRGDNPTRIDLSATGGFISGNLRQAQAQTRMHLSQSTKTAGFDLIGSAFRLWRPPEPTANLEQIGDDQSLLALPFYYFGERPYLLGLAQLERSGLRQIENRMSGGAAVGMAPIRENDRLVRLAIGALMESTSYATDELSPDWVPNANPRVAPRAFLVGNGWFRPKRSPVGGFFVGTLLVNPTEPKDTRGKLDAGIDVKLSRAVSVRLAMNLVHESVTPTGLLSTDLRSTVGLAWKSPQKKP